MKRKLLGIVMLASLLGGAAFGEGIPRIEVDRLEHDFGSLLGEQKVEGIFKVKNSGDGVLKLEKPTSSCGCTVPNLKKNELQPGEETEVPFTMDLGRNRTTVTRYITIVSNDPETPKVQLAVKADYTPLIEVTPRLLRADLRKGKEGAIQARINRNDGKKIEGAVRTSNPSVSADLDLSEDGTSGALKIKLAAREKLGSFTEFVRIEGEDEENPLVSLMITGRVLGDIAATPESLLWNVTAPAQGLETRNEAFLSRRVSVRSLEEKQPLELKNPVSTLEQVAVEIAPGRNGAPFQVTARLVSLPEKTVRGSIKIETNNPDQPELQLPVTIIVPVNQLNSSL
jgi:hypothetical protein